MNSSFVGAMLAAAVVLAIVFGFGLTVDTPDQPVQERVDVPAAPPEPPQIRPTSS